MYSSAPAVDWIGRTEEDNPSGGSRLERDRLTVLTRSHLFSYAFVQAPKEVFPVVFDFLEAHDALEGEPEPARPQVGQR